MLVINFSKAHIKFSGIDGSSTSSSSKNERRPWTESAINLKCFSSVFVQILVIPLKNYILLIPEIVNSQ